MPKLTKKQTTSHKRMWSGTLILVMLMFGIFGVHFLFHSHAATSILGDINGDGTVNQADLNILKSNWGNTSASAAQGDLNGDGTVDITDLSILSSNWGRSVGNGVTPATPADTGAAICNGGADASVLTGPSSAPSGAITVPAGDNGSVTFSAGKTYYFATGVHTLAAGQFGQIIPADNDTFIGAPGAIIDGQHKNQSAFTQPASNVTIKYLTIRNFAGTQDQFIVNHDSGPNWTISNNTIGPNDDGAAIGLGNNEQVTYNCVTTNGQYGINGYNAHSNGGPTPGVVIDHNEFADNDSHNYDEPQFPNDGGDCGCAGGLKLWQEVGTRVTNNYIHDNHDPGLWADTLNVGVDIEGNYISGNWGEGVFYEVSYNARIDNNNFVDNGWVKGPRNKGFPTAAVYISESGYDSRVDGGSGFTDQEIANNIFTDNWGGVILWENSNRYCSNGLPTDQCTLVNPTVVTVKSCAADLPAAPYINDCRWKTQNTNVHNNVFSLNPAHITGTTLPCTLANHCGLNGTISEFADTQYWPADTVPDNIALNQNNVFDFNTYTGPWQFESDEQNSNGHFLTFANWQVRHTTGNQKNAAQDVHSTYSAN